MATTRLGFEAIVESGRDLWEIVTVGEGPAGRLPLTAEMLIEGPSGDIFGLTQNAGMGWDPRELSRPQFLMFGTQGGIRAPDGRPIALGYHTGHWEIGLLMQAAAEELRDLERVPFAVEEGARVLAARAARPDLSPDPDIADDTRLWAALQQVGGGTWGGCVYDVDGIIAALGKVKHS